MQIRSTATCWIILLCVVVLAGEVGAAAPDAPPPGPADATVVAALDWLAAHQRPDGSWSFDHRAGACDGRCANAGKLSEAKNSSTALVCLAMLRAGETPQKGLRKESLAKGLRFLATNAKAGGSYIDQGNMYGHGLSSLALCEAWRRTKDEALKDAAQRSIDFIVSAQDPKGGGWRYVPKMSGDTSVTGWQVAALCVAKDSGLAVPPESLANVQKFLTSVQSDDGARYGYTTPGAGATTTAVGLASRLCLGTKPAEASFQRGVAYLEGTGPSRANAYYNYYATQVLHAAGGEPWERWKKNLQPILADTQEKNGHAAGSWHVEGGDHGADSGGRVYGTAMNLMTYCRVIGK